MECYFSLSLNIVFHATMRESFPQLKHTSIFKYQGLELLLSQGSSWLSILLLMACEFSSASHSFIIIYSRQRWGLNLVIFSFTHRMFSLCIVIVVATALSSYFVIKLVYIFKIIRNWLKFSSWATFNCILGYQYSHFPIHLNYKFAFSHFDYCCNIVLLYCALWSYFCLCCL